MDRLSAVKRVIKFNVVQLISQGKLLGVIMNEKDYERVGLEILEAINVVDIENFERDMVKDAETMVGEMPF